MKVTINWDDLVTVTLTPQGREYLNSLQHGDVVFKSGMTRMSLARLIRTFGPGIANGHVSAPFVRGNICLDVRLPRKRCIPSKSKVGRRP